MALDLAPEAVEAGKQAAAMTIRFPDTEAASAAAAAMRAREVSDLRNAEMLDAIKTKITAGAALSTEEQIFYNKAIGHSDPNLPAQPAAQEPAKTTEAPAADDNLAKIDALTEKLAKGEALTEDEEKFLETVRETPALPEKVYRIGGQEFNSAQLAEEMAKSMGIAVKDLEPLGPQALEKMLDSFHAERNKAEWQAAYSRRDQGLAKQRRQVSEMAMNLTQQAQAVQRQLQDATAALDAAKALAAKNIDPNDVTTEDGRLDPVKFREVNRVLEAREKLPMLTQSITALNEQAVQTAGQLTAQRFRDFQAAHPQYQLSMSIVDASAAASQGQLEGDDLFKWLEMVDIFRSADIARIHPDDMYDFKANARQLSVAPASTGGGSRGTDPRPIVKRGKEETDKLIAALRAKRTTFAGASGGGAGSRPEPKSKERLAAETIAASARNAMGVGGSNPTMSDLDY